MNKLKYISFDYIKALLLVFLFIYSIYFFMFPQEAFAMDPYEKMVSDECFKSDEDIRASFIISAKEDYTSHSGMYTYNTRRDEFDCLYPRGLVLDSNIINDSYDNKKYFDIPLTMICGESKNIEPGIYSGCIPRNIDGLLIWPERLAFHAEFVKDYTQVIAKDSNISSVSLGARVIDRVVDRFVFIYIKCQDINAHKYHWTIWEKSSMLKYWSYKDFKKRWDSETNVWSSIDENIRKDIIIEVKDLLGLKRVDESLRKSIRSEVEKLIHKTRPFSTSSF